MNHAEIDLLGFQMIGPGLRDEKVDAITRLQSITWLCRALVHPDMSAPDQRLCPGSCKVLSVGCKKLVETLVYLIGVDTERLRPV